MTRAELEAAIWAITGRGLTGAQVDGLLNVAEQYAAERLPHQPRTVLHHAGGTDLYPLIGVLAAALRGEDGPELANVVPLRRTA